MGRLNYAIHLAALQQSRCRAELEFPGIDMFMVAIKMLPTKTGLIDYNPRAGLAAARVIKIQKATVPVSRN